MRGYNINKAIDRLLRQSGISDFTKEQLSEFVETKLNLNTLWKQFNEQDQAEESNLAESSESEDKKISDSVQNEELHELKVKNAFIDKDYELQFDLPNTSISVIDSATSEQFENIEYDLDTKTLKAKPTSVGDATLDITYSVKKKIRLKLYVNDDPRNLWKDIPSDEKYKADNESREIKDEDFRIVSASRRGRSHAKKGTARDDHFDLDSHEGWAISIVADGAGSAKNSKIGSKVACETILCSIKESLSEKALNLDILFRDREHPKFEKRVKTALYEILVKASHKALSKMHEVAKDLDIPNNSLSTTISIGIAKKFDFGYFYGTFQVGDGNISLYSVEDISTLCKTDKGEYSNQTRFINSKGIFTSSEELMNRIFFKVLPEAKPLLLMTDGVVDGKFDSPEDIFTAQETWNVMWNELKNIVNLNGSSDTQLLEWLNFYTEGEHDDRTLSMILPIN